MKIHLHQFVLLLFFCQLSVTNAHAQLDTSGLRHLFVTPENYTAGYTDRPIRLDGRLNEEAWLKAPWSRAFTDIEGDRRPKPSYPTKMKMLWDDTCLYIAATLTEPDVWATLRNHDTIVFYNNDFEVFIDPDNNTHYYYEVEVNPYNTIFDLLLPKPYRNGGSAVIDWDLKGLRSAVSIQGSINNPEDRDSGWTVEMAIPFRSIAANRRQRTGREGELWRINFSRVEWDFLVQDGKYSRMKDSSGRVKPEHNWVWSEQGVVNMHFPERWGYLRFSKQPPGGPVDDFVMPYAEQQKKYLWICYYRQKAFTAKHKRYAASFRELGIEDPTIIIGNKSNALTMEATSRQFMVYIKGEEGMVWSINDDGLVQSPG